MVEGRIIKGIGGFYYVSTDRGLIECKPRGIFRKEDIIPLVGDKVRISFHNDSQLQGVIEEILPRETMLLRPAVANVEQCVVVVSIEHPKPDLLFLDRLLVLTEISNLEMLICFNKIDLAQDLEYKEYVKLYGKIGYPVVCTSVKTGEGIDGLRNALQGRISVFSGLSGVGKSSLLNSVQPHFKLKTGQISNKLKRGRHTTRHVELMKLMVGGMVVDTPGFSSIKLGLLDEHILNEYNLCNYFPEFQFFMGSCRFSGCRHINEPDCSVKKAVENGDIAEWRYRNFIKLTEELKKSRRKRYD